VISVLEKVMLARPEHWIRYYRGTDAEQALKRKYSLSDRIRYYWTEQRVQQALDRMLANLTPVSLPLALLKQFVPDVLATGEENWNKITPEHIFLAKIKNVLDDYKQACDGEVVPSD
jgi:D-tagatose-1,6-bisphosphate aldolase subunit GatZ/KbaZ